MHCQHQGCSESAVAHLTEVGGGAPTELHLCQRHVEEYLSADPKLQNQLRRAFAASAGQSGPASTAETAACMVKFAVEELGRIKAEEAVSSFVTLLKDQQPAVRWAAVVFLARNGLGSPEAMAALRASLEDNDADVREAAVWALTRIDRKAPPKS